MTELNITISAIDKIIGFMERLFSREDAMVQRRLDAVEAIYNASTKTRNYISQLEKQCPIIDDNIEDEISRLWFNANEKIASIDPDLAYECIVKAYGWRTGIWNDPAFSVVPRRVEEIQNDAAQLIKKYQSIIKK